MDVVRERLSYSNLRARVLAQAQTYRPNKIVVEDAGAGTNLVQELTPAGLPIVAVKPECTKVDRLATSRCKI
jgi:hypothetical protein